MKGVLPCLVYWARCVGTRNICPVLAAQSRRALFQLICPQAWQAVVPGRLSLNMSLW